VPKLRFVNCRRDEVSTGSLSDRVSPFDVNRIWSGDLISLKYDPSANCGRFLFALDLGKAKSKE
jgi:hypothetical protein